jgi:phage terminase large subunit-like protein
VIVLAFPTPTSLDEEEEWRVPGPAFLYDAHFFSRSAETLSEEGLNMLEVPQTDSRMVPASQRFFEVIKTSELEHDGDLVMRKHIRSVVPKLRERGWRINKMDSTKSVDGAVAGAMSVYYCTEGLDDGYDEAPNIW